MEIIGSALSVPVRCVDIGGWLDTWFAKYGKILNLGVLSRLYGKDDAPFRGIDVIVSQDESLDGRVINIYAADPHYDIRVYLDDLLAGNFNHSNLLLATLYLAECQYPNDGNLNIHIASPIPPGASLGTSAAVSVAVIIALGNATSAKNETAYLAWRAETEVMKGQSGTQDQFAAAFGHSVNFIEVTEFPNTSCRKIDISEKTKNALEEGLITICYGKHDSSASHLKVIKELETEGPEAPRLQNLRALGGPAKEYLLAEDLVGFGFIMKQNTAAQDQLCEGIVSDKAKSVIRVGQAKEALGWKVNGAGGLGGSITFLFPSREKAQEFYEECNIIYPPELGFIYFEHKLAS